MNNFTPLLLYQKMLAERKCKYDMSQELIIIKMNNIHKKFVARYHKSTNYRTKILDKFTNFLLGKIRKHNISKIIKGLYIWGSTGIGKTLLMDIFYHSLPGTRKLRLHFHKFMTYVHKEMSYLQGYEDPLKIIADKLISDIDVLCFDEFFITDIVDAILLGTLIKLLLMRGITLVITSNFSPDRLYFHGFQRSRFLPVIKLIKSCCDVIYFDSVFDYRTIKFCNKSNVWFFPIGDGTERKMIRMFNLLSGSSFFVEKKKILLKINNRLLPVIALVNGVLFLDFIELCNNYWCYSDYIILAQRFHSILLRNVKQMGNTQENVARRFLSLIDELYEHHVKLVVSSSVSISEVYNGSKLRFEYQRCLSRLYEMQGEEYFNLPHNS